MSSSFTRNSEPQKRVVVTGLGAVTPLGLNLSESWANVLNGKSGIAPITRFNTEAYDVKFAGEVKGFNPDEYIHKKEQKKMDTFIHYALAAARMAIVDSKLDLETEDRDRIGCIVGVGMGGLPSIEEQHLRILEKGPGKISPFFIPMVITNLASGQISIEYGLTGPNFAVTSACASGVHALGEAVNAIRLGKADVVVTGGSESTVCPLAVGGFASMRALSTRNDSPEKASRPFDKDRDGFVLGEGAAIFVVESLEHATKRGANILCEVSGYGYSSDAYHISSPAPEGVGAAKAMKMALADAGLSPELINYINAHGTSTPMGDEIESTAIKTVFGEHAKKLWVSSTKSMTGHLLGAAGAIEGAFCVLALRDQIAPPTINLDNPGEGCDLDYVANVARKGKLTHVMNNSFGFGGTNACIIFSKL